MNTKQSKGGNKPKLSREAVSSSLLLTNPQQTTMDIATAPQAFPGMFMNLSVHEVDFFDKNPRKRHDAETYQQIKESIRASGVQQPVHVTQRPGDKRYILAQGGNTRLQIMKELLEETGDNRFAVIPCIYIEYTSDTDIQIAHLIENEQRQEMCFWDKACAYGEIRDTFQVESERMLSLRELESLFLTHGLSLTHQTLALLFFARDNLTELSALAIYLSNAKTVDIRKLHNQLRDTAKSASQEETFAAWWPDALSAWVTQNTGADDLDVAALSRYLHNRFKEDFDCGEEETGEEGVTWTGDADPTAPADPFSDRVSGAGLEALLTDKPETDPATGKGGRGAVNPHSGREMPEIPETKAGVSVPPSEPMPAPPQFATREEALKPLHRSIKNLLEAVKLSECFKSCPHFTYDFYIEYPDFERIARKEQQEGVYLIIDNRHPDAGNVWMLLSKISGQEDALYDPMMGNNNPILKLASDSRLLSAYRDQEVLDQYTELGIGERPYLIDSLIKWQCTDHPLNRLTAALFTALKAVNDMDEGATGGAA